MLILGIDLGWRNLGMALIEWPKVGDRNRARKCVEHWAFCTNELQDSSAWNYLLVSLCRVIEHAVKSGASHVALEDVRGVRYGKSQRGQTSSDADRLVELQGAVRLACAMHRIQLTIVRSQSVYSALGAKVQALPGETTDRKRARQKACTAAAIRRLMTGTDLLSQDELDACAHAAAVIFGKGQLA